MLELDHYALKEMGISSLADRIRILAAVKTLRIRCLVVHPLSNGGGSNGYSHYQSGSNKVTFWVSWFCFQETGAGRHTTPTSYRYIGQER